LADGEASRVAGPERRQVTGHTGDVLGPAPDLVERERLAQGYQGGADRCRTTEGTDATAGRERADLVGEGAGGGL